MVFCKNNHILTHLLPSVAGASADGTQIFLLPLVSNLVHFAIVVARRLIWERKLASPLKLLQENITTALNKYVSFNVHSHTGFTLELSLSVAQAGAAHHVTVLSMAIPLLANAVVVAVVVTPLCRGFWEQQGAGVRVRRKRSRELLGNVAVETHPFPELSNMTRFIW